jgi:hypothetical protein
MQVWNELNAIQRIYDGTEWVDFDVRKNCNGHILIAGPSTATEPAGNWAYTANANQYMNGYYDNTAAAANLDNVTYQLCLSIGTYTLDVWTKTDVNGGIIDVDLTDPGSTTTEVASFDLYSNPVVVNVKKQQAAIGITVHGLYTMKVRVDGKNALSGGHDAWITYIAIWRTA